MNPEPSDKRCQEILSDLLLALEGVREGKMFGVPRFFVGRNVGSGLTGQNESA
jgi:hypothetical protein